MKANDLIHNGWYILNGMIKRYNVLDNLMWELERYEPIPLTPEILEKAGFEEVYKSPMHTTFYKDKISYYFWHIEYKQYADFMGNQYNHIQNLHQLQNLYFALTGEELNINL